MAENYAALIEEDVEEIEDGPTETTEKGEAGKAAAPPPPVRGINQADAPLANLPVSMALPIIDPKQVVADMLAGKQPNLFGNQPAVPSTQAPVVAPPTAGGRGTGQGSAPRTPTPTPSGQQAFAPPAMAPQSSASGVAIPAADAAAAVPQPPMGFLDRLANLPLVFLILIGIALALSAAGITALILF